MVSEIQHIPRESLHTESVDERSLLLVRLAATLFVLPVAGAILRKRTRACRGNQACDATEEQEEEDPDMRRTVMDPQPSRGPHHQERQRSTTYPTHASSPTCYGSNVAHLAHALPLYILPFPCRQGVAMRIGPFALAGAIVTSLLAPWQEAAAVSLRPNKVTDDSVCDLAPNTTGFLGGIVLIPAASNYKDQVDAYYRLGATFVATKCMDGQVLILQAMADLPAAAAALSQIANSACVASTVARSEVQVPFMGGSEPGFELRCTISKRDELVARLADMERSDPLDSLRARLVSSARAPASTSAQGSDNRRDCSRLTLASLTQGGTCR